MSSDLKRPREDGGVWGSYVTYLADLETSVSGLRQELDEARAERDQLAAAVRRYVKYWGASMDANPRRALHEVELLAVVDAPPSATPDAEPAPGVPVDTEATP